MTRVLDELRQRGNKAVAFALTYARESFHHRRGMDGYAVGYALGQILVAQCDLFADIYLVQGAINEIDFLRRKSREGDQA